MKKTWMMAMMLAALVGCTDTHKTAEGDAVISQNDSIMAENGYEVVPLFKTRTGHLTATMRVNGKACVFLIDTGGGATLIDVEKKERYGLEAFRTGDYAAGIGSVRRLVRTSAIVRVNEQETREDSLFLMDISYLNVEFKKNHSRQVDGVLGTDFMERHRAVIDYSASRMYLKMDSPR